MWEEVRFITYRRKIDRLLLGNDGVSLKCHLLRLVDVVAVLGLATETFYVLYNDLCAPDGFL